MTRGTRSALTLGVLSAMLVVGGIWAYSAVTEPFPGKVEVPTCVERAVARGEKVYPDQVTVSVLNAGSREGLAARTMQLFVEQGFGEGERDNAPRRTRVAGAQLWTSTPRSPAVRLVATHLGPSAEVVRRDPDAAGVVVVVGDEFSRLVRGRKSVTALRDAEICSPPAS